MKNQPKIRYISKPEILRILDNMCYSASLSSEKKQGFDMAIELIKQKIKEI